MSETETQYPPLPPDDLTRTLRLAQQDNEGKLKHIGLVGDTYTILVAGEDTNDKFCVIDMHVPPGGGPDPIATILKRHSSCSTAKLNSHFAATNTGREPARPSTFLRTRRISSTMDLSGPRA